MSGQNDKSRTEKSPAHKVSRNAQLILQKHLAITCNTRIRHHTSMFVYYVCLGQGLGENNHSTLRLPQLNASRH